MTFKQLSSLNGEMAQPRTMAGPPNSSSDVVKVRGHVLLLEQLEVQYSYDLVDVQESVAAVFDRLLLSFDAAFSTQLVLSVVMEG